MNLPQYNFKDPVFQKHRQYIRFALEHIEMCKLAAQSDYINWEVKATTESFNIPTVYHVHYHIRSIIGIDAEQNPIYGNHHILELTIPTRYPIEPFGIYMITDLWHPNIKWDGKYKGRICANARDFGKSYMLSELVLRIGAILQYKNYLAEFVPPFPEDAKVAEWVREVGEPRGIVDRKKGIAVDDTPLLSRKDPEAPPPVVEVKAEEPVKPPIVTIQPVVPPPATHQKDGDPGEPPVVTNESITPPPESPTGIRVKPRASDTPPTERPKIIIGRDK